MQRHSEKGKVATMKRYDIMVKMIAHRPGLSALAAKRQNDALEHERLRARTLLALLHRHRLWVTYKRPFFGHSSIDILFGLKWIVL